MLSNKRKLALAVKNFPGWKTKKKIVAFAIDDYGNVHLASKKARENLSAAGLKMDGSRFSMYDRLEDANDLNALFEVLSAHKDKHQKNPIFTAFAMSANIDFEQVEANGLQYVEFETLPETFAKLPEYKGTWDLWKEGMYNKLLHPEYHGTQHLNIHYFNTLLKDKNKELLANIKNRSYAGIELFLNGTIGFTEAFSFFNFEENKAHAKTIKEGLALFKAVYGYSSTHFNAPGAREHSILEKAMFESGIKFIDTDFIKKEHQGNGKYKKLYRPFGSKNKFGQHYLFRNVVFEPLLDEGIDTVSKCMSEIEMAFRFNKPAIISSHRVNFCGGIEEGVRKSGLENLDKLLSQITLRWPEVEFMTTAEIGEEIAEEH